MSGERKAERAATESERERLLAIGQRCGLGAASLFLEAVARGEDEAVKKLVPHLRPAPWHGPEDMSTLLAELFAWASTQVGGKQVCRISLF